VKLKVNIITNLKTKEAEDKVKKANQLAMRDTVVDILNDSIKNAKAVKFWLTGNNARSLAGEVSGMGKVAGEGSQERIVDDNKNEGAVYSTSGYGGYGETGLVSKNYPPRPYMKPALDKNFTKEKFASKVKTHLGA